MSFVAEAPSETILGAGPSTVPAPDQGLVVPAIDHVALGLSRVASQYQRVPDVTVEDALGFGDGGFGDDGFGGTPGTAVVYASRFLAILTRLLATRNEVEAALQQLFLLPDIDAMTGVNLDTIGIIVGVSRYVPQALLFTFFGFSGEADQDRFGEASNLSIGSRFYEQGEPLAATSVMNDPEYRLVLRAKIIKNNSVATPTSILQALAYIVDAPTANIDDNGGMTFGVAIGRQLTRIEALLITELDLLPRPAGVSLYAVVSYNAAAYFGFQGQVNALPFTEDGTNNGAVWAEEII